MLVELRVRNFAIIDKIDVQFSEGFNVLSGETGSGKSIMLKSLALLMGGKSSPDTIKTGEKQASVEGAFDVSHRQDTLKALEGLGYPGGEDLLVVRRLINQDGRNRVYINGSIATLSQLKDLVSPLVEITGRHGSEGEPLSPLIEMTSQHENRNLQSKTYHLHLIDQYLGLFPLRHQLTVHFQEIRELKDEISDLEAQVQDREQRLDFLRFQSEEIGGLNLEPGEEDSLKQRTELLRNTGRLMSFTESAEEALYGEDDSALVRLHRVIAEATEFQKLDPTVKNFIEALQQAKTLIEDSVYELRDFGRSLELDGGDLQDAEEKLSHLRKLQKKYGGQIEDILKRHEEIQKEIENLENSEIRMADQRQKLEDVQKLADKLAAELHKKRKQGAKALVDSVQSELEDLNMKGVLFGYDLQTLDALTSTGITDIEFTIQASKKDKARPLAKFASGGELSRILLSLKRVIGQSDQPRSYLFDEVDAGVSGVTAEKVGRKLKSIAHGQQVICVTHLPQVAAFADAHFVISKSATKNRVQMSVESLDNKSRINEVARMISGEKISKTSLAHAKELIEEAH